MTFLLQRWITWLAARHGYELYTRQQIDDLIGAACAAQAEQIARLPAPAPQGSVAPAHVTAPSARSHWRLAWSKPPVRARLSRAEAERDVFLADTVLTLSFDGNTFVEHTVAQDTAIDEGSLLALSTVEGVPYTPSAVWHLYRTDPLVHATVDLVFDKAFRQKHLAGWSLDASVAFKGDPLGSIFTGLASQASRGVAS